MKDKKPTKQSPCHVIVVGPVCVAIYERMSNSGFAFYSMSISRQWENPTTGRKSTGSHFFHTDQAALEDAIAQGTAFIRKQSEGAAQSSINDTASSTPTLSDTINE